MNRVIISPIKKNGKHEVSVNPDFIYLDSSAWIYIFKAYVTHKEKIIDEIPMTIGNNKFKILISVINFLEFIGTQGDISENFSADYLGAIENIRLTSAHQPTIITDQEVFRFLYKEKKEVRILDTSNVALNSLIEGFEQRKKGNTAWFLKKRKWWDEMNERDRTMNLDADIYELSGIITYQSFSDVIKSRENMISGPIEVVKERKSEIGKQKMYYKGKKEIPSEEEEILKYAKNRIVTNIAQKYGEEKVSMLISNPSFVFPGKNSIIMDIKKGSELTFSKLKKQLPGLYWQSKISYYNYYHGPQGAGGQLGDRNHAIYIPYSNYFATSDRILVDALKSEYTAILTKDNLQLFKIT